VKIVKAVLPVVIVVLAFALLGPTAAMAETTALCTVDQVPCNSLVTHTHYKSESLQLLTTLGDYKCDGLYLANVLLLGSPQLLEGEFSYSNCDKGCTREEINGPVLLNLLKTGHETAVIEGTEVAEVKVKCSFLNCVYSFSELTGTAKGPLLAKSSNGEFVFNEALLVHVSGSLCPSTSRLDATYTLLSPAYISS